MPYPASVASRNASALVAPNRPLIATERTCSFVAETPFDRSPAMDEGKTAMLREFVDILRHAAALQIGRRRAGDEPMRRKQPCHQAAVVAAAEPDRKIDAFVDQIDIAVVEGDADRKLRPFVHEMVEDRQYMQPAERHRQFQPQPAARRMRVTQHRHLGLVEIGEDAHASFVKGGAFAGQRNASCRALQQPDAEPVFQPRHALSDRRSRQADLLGRGGETLGFGDVNETR